MSKIAIIDGYRTLAEMLAAPLQARGHDTHVFTPPLDSHQLRRFAPDLMVFGLDRRQMAQDRPVEHPVEEITGFAELLELSTYPPLNLVPFIIVGDSIKEDYVPAGIDYDLFIAFPDEVETYVAKIEEVLRTVRTRRHVSSYHCPTCGSRLTYKGRTQSELFCPKCHTVVVLTDGRCVMRTATGKPTMCSVDLLRAEK